MVTRIVKAIFAAALMLSAASAQAARLPSVTIWTNPATAIKATLSADWVALTYFWSDSAKIDETAYTHMFINTRTGVLAYYSCDDAYSDTTLGQYSNSLQAYNSRVTLRGPLVPVADTKTWNLWFANGNMQEGAYTATLYASKIGSIFCHIIYADMRDPTIRTIDDVEMTKALFNTARGELPAPLVNPSTDAPVIIPDGWTYRPDRYVPVPDVKFGVFFYDSSDEVAHYGCEVQPDVETAGAYADRLMEHFFETTWDRASMREFGADRAELSGELIRSDKPHATNVLIVKTAGKFCALIYRAASGVPDRQRYEILAKAIFEGHGRRFDAANKPGPRADRHIH